MLYANYWKKWCAWCLERKTNPLSNPIREVLDYFTELADNALAYRTIGVVRAAISAFHEKIDGSPVGEHSLVKMLHKGVNNRNPPMPKYCTIWDVEIVLNHMRTNWPDDSKLSLMELSEKTVTILALATASRGSELSMLDITLMAETDNKIQFWFNRQTKGCRGHQLPKPLEILASGMQLCPVKTTRAYLQRTKYEGRHPKLFLSTKAPYAPICRASIARWLKSTLKKVGIDTTAFGAHSVRSATTSAAAFRGVTIEDILERGQYGPRTVTGKNSTTRGSCRPTPAFKNNSSQISFKRRRNHGCVGFL